MKADRPMARRYLRKINIVISLGLAGRRPIQRLP